MQFTVFLLSGNLLAFRPGLNRNKPLLEVVGYVIGHVLGPEVVREISERDETHICPHENMLRVHAHLEQQLLEGLRCAGFFSH